MNYKTSLKVDFECFNICSIGICEIHFRPEDLIQTKNGKRRKLGSRPTRNLPKQSINFKSPRKPPARTTVVKKKFSKLADINNTIDNLYKRSSYFNGKILAKLKSCIV